jgi:hypothetical protein
VCGFSSGDIHVPIIPARRHGKGALGLASPGLIVSGAYSVQAHRERSAAEHLASIRRLKLKGEGVGTVRHTFTPLDRHSVGAGGFRPESFRSLSPAGLLVDDVAIEPDRIVITARCRAAAGKCPSCGRQSVRVHSRYKRRLLDLPSHGRVVQLQVSVRRFRCMHPNCPRRIFAEQLSDGVAGRSARRTFRLEAIVHHLGLALGGRPAATLARRLMLPVTKTLCCVLFANTLPAIARPCA